MSERPRGITVAEAMHPQPADELVRLAEAWTTDAADLFLASIWRGYEILKAEGKLDEAVEEATDDLERGITLCLYNAIQDGLTRLEPFDVVHGVPEGESRKNPPARPREYDIAFVHFGNTRIMWPVEAKVMPPLRTIGGYTETITDRYLSCEYAPFVGAGAMVGYVIGGDVPALLTTISTTLATSLDEAPPWPADKHRVSSHIRHVPAGKSYPADFRCHHLMMAFGTANVPGGCVTSSPTGNFANPAAAAIPDAGKTTNGLLFPE